METKIRIDTGLLLKFGLAIFGLVCLFWLATNSASAVPDFGNLTDANGNNALFFNDGGMVYINMTDGVTNGTTKASVNVTAKDMVGLDQIAVAVKDDGTGAPWDAPNDGIYWGKFSIRSDGGTSGAFTDDLADVLDMKDAQAFTVSANLDGLTANLTLTGTSDFIFPSVTNVIPVNDTVVKGNVVFKMTVTDLHRNDTRIGVTLPGDIPVYFDASGTPNIFNKTVNTDPISQGNRTFTFFAVDQAGNNETFDVYIHVDRTNPSVVINQPQASTFVSGNVVLNVTVNDAHVNASSVVYKIDGGTAIALPHTTGNYYETSVATATLTEGIHAFSIIAGDVVDNLNTTESVSFRVDRTMPSVGIVSTAGEIVATEYKLRINVTDTNLDESKIKYRLDTDVNWKPMTESTSTSGVYEATINIVSMGITEGEHWATFNVTDLAGNYNNTAKVNFTVDVTTPDVKILSTFPAIVNSTYTLRVEVVEAHLDTLVYVVGSSTPRPMFIEGPGPNGTIYTAAVDVSSFQDSTYYLTIQAKDLAGNNNLNDAPTMSLKVDKAAPTITGGVRDVQSIFSLEVNIIDSNIDTDTISFTLDGGAAMQFDPTSTDKYTYTFTPEEFTEGTHTIIVTAGDEAGNVVNKVFTYTYIDPPAQSENVKATANDDGSVTLKWSANTAIDLDHYLIFYTTEAAQKDSLDTMTPLNELIPNTATQFVITGLQAGVRYYIAVTAVDASGFRNETVIYDIVTPAIHVPNPVIDITYFREPTDNIKQGDEVVYQITIMNSGDADAIGVVVSLTDGGAPIPGATETVDIPALGGKNITLRVKFNDKGQHAIEITATGTTASASETDSFEVLTKGKTTDGGGGLGDYMFLIMIVIVVVIAVVVVVFLLKRKSPMDKEIEKEEAELGIGKGKPPQAPPAAGGPGQGPKLQPPPMAKAPPAPPPPPPK